MCIIALKPAGVNSLDWLKIETMFKNNSDGAGIAYTVPSLNHVNIIKGLMTYDTFKTTLEGVIKKYPLNELSLMLHFRITTHGGTSMYNTHPFVISDNIDDLKKLKVKTDVAVCMNGIVDVFFPKNSNHSDTMQYIVENISLWKKLSRVFYKKSCIMNTLNNTGAKWAFLDSKGKIYHNNGFNTLDGWLYSNFSYNDYNTHFWGDIDFDLPFYGYVELINGDVIDCGENQHDFYITPLDEIYTTNIDGDIIYLDNITNIYDDMFNNVTYDDLYGGDIY